jgi:hypothetical protein
MSCTARFEASPQAPDIFEFSLPELKLNADDGVVDDWGKPVGAGDFTL